MKIKKMAPQPHFFSAPSFTTHSGLYLFHRLGEEPGFKGPSEGQKILGEEGSIGQGGAGQGLLLAMLAR